MHLTGALNPVQDNDTLMPKAFAFLEFRYLEYQLNKHKHIVYGLISSAIHVEQMIKIISQREKSVLYENRARVIL